MVKWRTDDQLWQEAKKRCRLDDKDIALAKRLGLNPRSLIKNIPQQKERDRGRLPSEDWLHEIEAKRSKKAAQKQRRREKEAKAQDSADKEEVIPRRRCFVICSSCSRCFAGASCAWRAGVFFSRASTEGRSACARIAASSANCSMGVRSSMFSSALSSASRADFTRSSSSCGKGFPSSAFAASICAVVASSVSKTGGFSAICPAWRSKRCRYRLEVSACILAQRHAMGHLPFERQNIVPAEILQREGHLESAVGADGHRLLPRTSLNASSSAAPALSLSVRLSFLTVIPAKPSSGCGCAASVFISASRPEMKPLDFSNFLREFLQKAVLQLVLLALVVGLHQLQSRNVHIQIHLLFDSLVSGTRRMISA